MNVSFNLFHKETGEPLGAASGREELGELLLDLFFDDGIFSCEVRIEEVEEAQ
jgi:hypothetical protein